MAELGWYYCLKHHTVESENACRAADRLGPYPDRPSAEAALETVAKRNETWDNDPDWNEDDEDDDPGERKDCGDGSRHPGTVD